MKVSTKEFKHWFPNNTPHIHSLYTCSNTHSTHVVYQYHPHAVGDRLKVKTHYNACYTVSFMESDFFFFFNI